MAKQQQAHREKSLEQKVQESMLKKLFIKVNDDEIVIDKVNYVSLLMRNLIALAKSDFDIEKALALALAEQHEYKAIPEIKRKELQQSAIEFRIEADAYRNYLTSLKDKKADSLILAEVHAALNSEPELLKTRLREIITDSLSDKITAEETASMGIDQWELIGKYCDYVMLIAESESIDQAVDKLMPNLKMPADVLEERRESLKEGMMRIASFAGDEIDAVELAITMRQQNAEYYRILMKVKEELGLDD